MGIHRFALVTLSVAGVSIGLCQFASAADMPIKAARSPVAVTYNWSGFYVGANAGYGWGRSSWKDDPIFGAADLGAHNFNGGILGG